MDTEPDSEGMRDGEEGDNAETSERAPEITEAEESPDQSVSSAGASGTTVPLSREADEGYSRCDLKYVMKIVQSYFV